MNILKENLILALMVGMGLLIPLPAYALPVSSVPEPVSLTLLATGLGALGVAELIRRRKNK